MTSEELMLMGHGNGNFKEVQVANEYLQKEYELCFEQLRFYDTRQNDILKYIFGLTSAVATAQFAIYKINQDISQGFYFCLSFLSIIVFIATLLLFLAMLQNRLYFVYIARQINAIRGYLMLSEAPEFKNNQLYVSTTFSAWKPSSVHTFQLFGSAILSSLFSGLSAYSIFQSIGFIYSVSLSILVLLVILIAEICGGIIYLSVAGSKPADDAIHNEKILKTPESG